MLETILVNRILEQFNEDVGLENESYVYYFMFITTVDVSTCIRSPVLITHCLTSTQPEARIEQRRSLVSIY